MAIWTGSQLISKFVIFPFFLKKTKNTTPDQIVANCAKRVHNHVVIIRTKITENTVAGVIAYGIVRGNETKQVRPPSKARG